MAYVPGAGKAVIHMLDDSAADEKLEISNDEFVVRTGKAYKIALTVAAVVAIGIGLWQVSGPNRDVALLFLSLGGIAALLLLTLFTYRCRVNQVSMTEDYWVLCIKIRKQVLWEDIRYRKLVEGNNTSLSLYDENKKKRISFDKSLVGYDRIVKMAKRSSIRQLK